MAALTIFTSGNHVTEENQLALMPSMAKAGVEAYWLDAGWYEGGYPGGDGSWVPQKKGFPRGLKPVGEGARKLDMKFVLWFEPERVTPFSLVSKEHPEWVMHHPQTTAQNGLFDLGDPDARKWLTDHISQFVTDWGIDIYRNDCNIDPLPFWRAADPPDRQGMAEIRYVEGLYAMWDELRARNPNLTIDNCCSGGRRIDLEMTSRSYPLWQSDTPVHYGRDMAECNQVQNAGLSLYVPLHSGGVWSFDPYNFRSAATAGVSVCADLSIDPAGQEAARKMIAEAKALRPCYLGDYYPLLDITAHKQSWCAWQYDRPDLGRGFFMCFRREKSPFPGTELKLHGLEEGIRYRVTNMDDHSTQTFTGAELAKRFSVEILESPGSVLFTYEKLR